MRFAFYGDDFTGSVDALLQFRRTGLDGVLVTSAAAVADVGEHDVVGIAGIARSLPTSELESEVVPALTALLALRPQVLQYKVCSTADSSPEIGSIGRAIEIGRALLGDEPVPVLFAQPDFGRWTAFSHHFAAEAGQVYRLDRQPTMANHPVTPATESDLRLHLAAQTSLTVAGLPWTSYGDSIASAPATLSRHARTGADVLVLDALTDEHLRHLGEALLFESPGRGPRFVVGSGGLSRGLGLGAGADAPAVPTTVPPAPDRVLVLSGSASALTWRQTQAAAAAGFTIVDLFAEGAHEQAVRLLSEGSDVVVHATSPGAARSATSDEVETRLAAIGTAALRTRPATRLVVCGGDTSGNVLRRLGIESLHIEATPWGNVSSCRARGTAEHLGGGIVVVLKGGQMGHVNLFDDVRTGTATT